MAVKLEFLTTDPEEIELVNRYWGMNEQGEFLELLKDLAPFREIKHGSQLTKHVRELCIAYDLNHLCKCGNNIRATGRTDLKKVAVQSSRPCDECLQTQQREKEEQEAAQKAVLDAKIALHIAGVKRKTISYQEVPEDAVLVLLALYGIVGARLWAGRFKYDDCRVLTPHAPGEFIERLYDQGILADDPEGAWCGTYYVNGDSLCIRLDYAHLFLPPDEAYGSGEETFSQLRDRTFTDAEALSNLWLDYACDDVIWYLMNQCELHNQEIYPEDYVKIRDLIRDGLRTYSVAQMWFIMWKVARDAAALSRRSYYSQQSATATIPTKIRKQLEIADQTGELRDTWKRSHTHIAGTLGKVFSELFAIDERSPGASVLNMFEELCKTREPVDEVVDELAATFMRVALERNKSLPALNAFSEMVRMGLTTEDALIETVHRYPALFD